MKLVIPRAQVLDLDLIIGHPGYTVWKGKRKQEGGNGLEGQEMRTLDPITELDLDGEHLIYLIEHGLLDGETCHAFFEEEEQVSLNYIHAGWGIIFINFLETVFRDPDGLPRYLHLFFNPDTCVWEKSLHYF